MNQNSAKKLPDSIELDFHLPLLPQLTEEILSIKINQCKLFKIQHFLKLQRNERQTDVNYVAVDRTKDGYQVYDNIHYREKHDVAFATLEEVATYVEELLNQKTVLDLAQIRSSAERNVRIGDAIEVQKDESSEPFRAVLFGYRDIYPESAEQRKDFYDFGLYYRKFNKNGSLSKKVSHIYQNMIIKKYQNKI